MHDINGKSLKDGDQFITYKYGLCTVQAISPTVDHMVVMYETMGGGTFGCDQETFRKEFPEAIKVRQWKELAQEALDVQNASNLSGVSNSFAQVVRETRARLEAEGKGGNRELHSHPLIQMWADKIASLTGTQNSVSWASKAYDWANEQIKK